MQKHDLEQMEKYESQIEIIKKYIIDGVQASRISDMCKELNINESKLNEFLNGQTMGMIENEAIVYVYDILKFLRLNNKNERTRTKKYYL